jgi:beta-phosphoglucomutase-like phosphatase (HAD superfamily)
MYFDNPTIENTVFPAELIVLDLNGLVVDDEPLQLAATNAALAPHGVQLSEDRWISACVGYKPAEFLPGILGPGGRPETVAALVAAKDRAYERLMAGQGRGLLRPGVMAFIKAVGAMDRTRTALATSTTTAGVDTIVTQAAPELIDRFDFVICGDQVAKAKPDPEIYRRVRAHFKPAGRCVAFEDSPTGVAAAKAAGFVCVAVPNRFTLASDLRTADLRISDMTPGAEILG